MRKIVTQYVIDNFKYTVCFGLEWQKPTICFVEWKSLASTEIRNNNFILRYKVLVHSNCILQIKLVLKICKNVSIKKKTLSVRNYQKFLMCNLIIPSDVLIFILHFIFLYKFIISNIICLLKYIYVYSSGSKSVKLCYFQLGTHIIKPHIYIELTCSYQRLSLL